MFNFLGETPTFRGGFRTTVSPSQVEKLSFYERKIHWRQFSLRVRSGVLGGSADAGELFLLGGREICSNAATTNVCVCLTET